MKIDFNEKYAQIVMWLIGGLLSIILYFTIQSNPLTAKSVDIQQKFLDRVVEIKTDVLEMKSDNVTQHQPIIDSINIHWEKSVGVYNSEVKKNTESRKMIEELGLY